MGAMLDRLKTLYRSTFGHAALGAVLLWAALPPLELAPLAWIAPVWWVLLIRRKELVGRRPYGELWLAGLLFWLATLYWLCLPHWSTSFGWLALSLYFAFYLPVFVGLARVAVHRMHVSVIVAAPVVWMGLELARAWLLTGMTMASLGHTQYRWIELIQMSDLAGALGVGFVVMMVAACLGRMIPCDGRPVAWWPVLPAVVVMTAALGYGYARISNVDARPDARVALIQGCIDAKLKGDKDMYEEIFLEYHGLSMKALKNAEDANERIDLIVWPESMLPYSLVDLGPKARKPDHFDCSDKEFADLPRTSRQFIAENTAMDFRTPTLLGLNAQYIRSDGMDIFNSAVLVMREGQFSSRYDKMHLVMFGEYVPFADTFPWLQQFTPLPLSVVAGKQPEVFELGPLRMAPNICYESVLSRVVRRQVNELRRQGKEPNVLVNITNDGWYWGSSELDLHLICGVFRAVECRKPMLIAANTGFSAWIDADGRIRRRGPRHDKGIIMAEVSIDDRHSWYLTGGDWPAGICLAACAVFALVGLWKRQMTKEPQGASRAV